MNRDSYVTTSLYFMVTIRSPIRVTVYRLFPLMATHRMSHCLVLKLCHVVITLFYHERAPDVNFPSGALWSYSLSSLSEISVSQFGQYSG